MLYLNLLQGPDFYEICPNANRLSFWKLRKKWARTTYGASKEGKNDPKLDGEILPSSWALVSDLLLAYMKSAFFLKHKMWKVFFYIFVANTFYFSVNTQTMHIEHSVKYTLAIVSL
jgi:hypothetical protein